MVRTRKIANRIAPANFSCLAGTLTDSSPGTVARDCATWRRTDRFNRRRPERVVHVGRRRRRDKPEARRTTERGGASGESRENHREQPRREPLGRLRRQRGRPFGRRAWETLPGVAASTLLKGTGSADALRGRRKAAEGKSCRGARRPRRVVEGSHRGRSAGERRSSSRAAEDEPLKSRADDEESSRGGSQRNEGTRGGTL